MEKIDFAGERLLQARRINVDERFFVLAGRMRYSIARIELQFFI